MSQDYQIDYWFEALDYALEAEGHFNSIPDDVKRKVAKSLAESAEMQGQAFGWDAIPNPENAEIAKMKKRYESKIKELEEKELNYRKSVAQRRGVELHQVYMDRDGSVMISTR
jgi:hypothetical protein